MFHGLFPGFSGLLIIGGLLGLFVFTQIERGLHLRAVRRFGMFLHVLLRCLVVIDGVGFDVFFRSLLLIVRIGLLAFQLFDQFDGTAFLTRSLGDDVDMQVVEGRLGLHPQMRRLRRLDFGMLTASMVD